MAGGEENIHIKSVFSLKYIMRIFEKYKIIEGIEIIFRE
jgi:hypothetical protein